MTDRSAEQIARAPDGELVGLRPSRASRTSRRRSPVHSSATTTLLIPAAALITGLVLVPSVYTVVLSFKDASLGGGSSQWVGLENYSQWFTSGDFGTALWLTVKYCLISVVLALLVGLFVGLLLNVDFRGRAFVRSVMLLPWVLPSIAAANIWTWMLNPDSGIIGTALEFLHLTDSPIQWLSSPDLALPVAAIVRAWRNFPFAALILLAGLQIIPKELYEAARVDGAGAVQRFFHVTLPSLRLVMLLTLMLESIYAFNDFSIFLLTQGGPADSSAVLSISVYQRAFAAGQFGYGAAGAVLTLLSLAVLVSVYLRYYNRGEREVRA